MPKFQRLPPSNSRFTQKFDPKVKVFVAKKKIDLGELIILPGEYVFPDASFPARRVELLFNQRFMTYLPDEKAVEKALADKAEADKKAAEAKAEADKKALEAAKLVGQN
jgi:hypothetical protein